MKYIFSAFALTLFSLTAWAVSLDFPQFTAVTIGDVQVVKSDETTETSVLFSGEGLELLYNFLPEVGDEETGMASASIRGFDIFSSKEDSPSQKINFQCAKKASTSVDCRITITKGEVPG